MDAGGTAVGDPDESSKRVVAPIEIDPVMDEAGTAMGDPDESSKLVVALVAPVEDEPPTDEAGATPDARRAPADDGGASKLMLALAESDAEADDVAAASDAGADDVSVASDAEAGDEGSSGAPATPPPFVDPLLASSSDSDDGAGEESPSPATPSSLWSP